MVFAECESDPYDVEKLLKVINLLSEFRFCFCAVCNALNLWLMCIYDNAYIHKCDILWCQLIKVRLHKLKLSTAYM